MQRAHPHLKSLWRREPLLPVDAKRIPKIRPKPRVPSLAVIFTYAWVILSAAVAIAGYLYCSASATRVSLVCDKDGCIFERRFGSSQKPAERVAFPRQNLLTAQTTRTRNGEAVDFQGVRRRRQRVLGHSFSIRYKLKDPYGRQVRHLGDEEEGETGKAIEKETVLKDESGKKSNDGARQREEQEDTFTEHTILFTKYNIGRKRSRRQASLINSYIRRDVETLDIQEEKSWTVFGVLIVVFGLIAGIFGALLGDLTDSGSRKREKKSF